MEETPVKDETGTVAKPMTRSEIEAEIGKQVSDAAAPLLAEIKDPEARKKADEAIRRMQVFMAMFNMWCNAVIADIAATTVYTFQQTYDWKGFMEYQAMHNAAVAEVVQASQDALNRIDAHLVMLVQELRKLQPPRKV